MKRAQTAGIAGWAFLLVAACSAGAQPAGQANTATQTLTVFAAASLKTTFTAMGEKFQSANAGRRSPSTSPAHPTW